jgi:hypothetical protein
MFLLANILKRQRLDVDSKSVGPKNVSNVSNVCNVSVPTGKHPETSAP